MGFLVMNEKRLPKTSFRTGLWLVFFSFFFFFEEATAEKKTCDLKQPSRFAEFRRNCFFLVLGPRDPYFFHPFFMGTIVWGRCLKCQKCVSDIPSSFVKNLAMEIHPFP